MIRLTRTFLLFARSEQAGGALLVLCTAVSLAVTNSQWGPQWLAFWQVEIAGLTLQHWINDALMALFFLLVGLELERELYVGELSDFGSALLPVVAAIGGLAVPTAIHFALNAGRATQAGAGIPMATDIAFALAALALLGSRIPASLKVFLTALAVIDDLVAILVIAAAYSSGVSPGFLLAAAGVFAALVALNRRRVTALAPYLAGGIVLWVLMLKSGIHATVSGVLLAFAIPFAARAEDETSPSHRLESALHRPVAFVVLPAFALANTGVVLSGGLEPLLQPNGLGIILGLVAGKPLGITLACLLAVGMGLRRPADLAWSHIVGAGLLGGIGFTMSIFIANLAFPHDASLVNGSKLAILVASVIAAGFGLAWLWLQGRGERKEDPGQAPRSRNL